MMRAMEAFETPLFQKRPDVVFPAIELRLSPRPLGPTEALAARPGARQTLLGPLHDQVTFDLGKEPEENDHRLGLEILLALEADGGL